MGCVLLGLPIFTGCRGCHHFLGGLCGGYVGVSCLGGNTTLCKPRSELNVDIIYIPIKICNKPDDGHCWPKHVVYTY